MAHDAYIVGFGIDVEPAPGVAGPFKHIRRHVLGIDVPVRILEVPFHIGEPQSRQDQLGHVQFPHDHRIRQFPGYGGAGGNPFLDVQSGAQRGRIQLLDPQFQVVGGNLGFQVHTALDVHSLAFQGPSQFPGGKINGQLVAAVVPQVRIHILEGVNPLFVAGSQFAVVQLHMGIHVFQLDVEFFLPALLLSRFGYFCRPDPPDMHVLRKGQLDFRLIELQFLDGPGADPFQYNVQRPYLEGAAGDEDPVPVMAALPFQVFEPHMAHGGGRQPLHGNGPVKEMLFGHFPVENLGRMDTGNVGQPHQHQQTGQEAQQDPFDFPAVLLEKPFQPFHG